MLNNTHELIQEISPYWNEQSDLDHFYRNTLRILNSHSERIDTALALLERTIANTICPVCNGDGYTVEADHGCGGDESRCYAICPVQVQAQCDCETHKLNFIKQQNATNI